MEQIISRNRYDIFLGFLVFVSAFGIKLYLGLPFQFPGHSDPSAYVIVANNLYEGRGFVENYIGNWLNPDETLFHPSNEYWQPLASVVMFLFYKIFGQSFRAAQMPSILMGSILVVVAYGIALHIFNNRVKAIIASLLVLFAPSLMIISLQTASNIYAAVFQVLFLFGTYLVVREKPKNFYYYGMGLGVLAALAVLSRGDQQLLIPVLFICLLFSPHTLGEKVKFFAVFSGVYAVCMFPWYMRNYLAFGGTYSPAVNNVFWARTPHNLNFYFYHYDYSWQTLIDGGWNQIKVRLLQKPYMNIHWFVWAVTLSSLVFFFIGARKFANQKVYLPAFVLLLFYLLFYTLLASTSTPGNSASGIIVFIMLIVTEGIYLVYNYLKARLPGNFHAPILVVLTLVSMGSFFSFYFSGSLQARALGVNQSKIVLEEIHDWLKAREPKDPVIMTNLPWEMHLVTRYPTIHIPFDNGTMPGRLATVTLPYMPSPLYRKNVVLELIEKYKVNYIILVNQLWWNVSPDTKERLKKVLVKPNEPGNFGSGYTIYRVL